MAIDIKSPSPLAFDKVIEGMAVAAPNSPLFSIPTEILANIVNYIATDNEDLASLAFVNSDCRQLARSCQFRTVELDSGPHSHSILEILQREAVERRQNRGYTRSLSLGACIRRVVVGSASYWKEVIASRPLKPGRSILDTSYDEDKVEQWHVFLGELTYRFEEIYRPNVLFVIPSLVHLESLEIDQASWSQSFLNNLTACTIKHLSLREVQMTEIVPVMEASVVLPLETLDICLSWDFNFSRSSMATGASLNASNSWNTILRMCSASLKILTLSHRASVMTKEDTVSFSLQFPKLRQLDLIWESHLDQSALQSLIFTSPYLSTLAINYGHQPVREFLDREGQIRSLDTLVLNHSLLNHSDPILDNSPLDFLKKNPQLKAFAFLYAETSRLLERTLSLLAAFSQLETLSMTWNGVRIPDSSLNILACLSSLESLHLSSGLQAGWEHNWHIPHETIISRLKPLSRLRRLAFTCEVYSYIREGRLFTYGSYSQLRSEAWDLHHQSMRAQALAYAQKFPDLEFIHVGQISFNISRVKNRIELQATDEELFSWRRSMFGMNR